MDPAEALLPPSSRSPRRRGRRPGRMAARPRGDQAQEWMRTAPLAWAYVEEARPRIVTRRDVGRPAQWLLGKNVLVLGCGALGARVAEHCVRAGVRRLTVADSDVVGPGVLVRQPYEDIDIGLAEGAAAGRPPRRIRPSSGVQVEAEVGDIRRTILGSDAARPKGRPDRGRDRQPWRIGSHRVAAPHSAGTLATDTHARRRAHMRAHGGGARSSARERSRHGHPAEFRGPCRPATKRWVTQPRISSPIRPRTNLPAGDRLLRTDLHRLGP